MANVEEIMQKYIGDDSKSQKESLAAAKEFDRLLDGIENTANNIIKTAVPSARRVPLQDKPALVSRVKKLYGKLASAYIDLGHTR